MNEYFYKSAYIFFQDRGESPTGKGWYADCYPVRKRWESTTVIGPFPTKEQAEKAVDEAP